MRHKIVKALRAELIRILGTAPTPRQWRAYKKRREIIIQDISFQPPNPRPTSQPIIPSILKPPKRQSWWQKLFNFIKRFLWK